jgi:hypothetical protein
LGEHQVGAAFDHAALHTFDQSPGELAEILVGPHRIEIDVGSQAEDVENLVEHLPVLRCAEQNRLEPRASTQLSNDGSHLDCFWARPNDDEDTFQCDRASQPACHAATRPSRCIWMWFYGSMIHAINDDVFLGFTVSSVMYFPTSHDVASGNAHRRHIHSITKRDVADALHCRAGNQGDSASELLRARR